MIDADTDIDGPDGPAETTVAGSTACDSGGRVELRTMHGVGHAPTFSDTFPDAIVDFLLEQERTAPGLALGWAGMMRSP